MKKTRKFLRVFFHVCDKISTATVGADSIRPQITSDDFCGDTILGRRGRRPLQKGVHLTHFFHIGSHITAKRREQAPALQHPRHPSATQSLYVFQSTHKFACEFGIEKDIKRNKVEQRNERSLRAKYTNTQPYTLSFQTKHFISARKKRYGVREAAAPLSTRSASSNPHKIPVREFQIKEDAERKESEQRNERSFLAADIHKPYGSAVTVMQL